MVLTALEPSPTKKKHLIGLVVVVITEHIFERGKSVSFVYKELMDVLLMRENY